MLNFPLNYNMKKSRQIVHRNGRRILIIYGIRFWTDEDDFINNTISVEIIVYSERFIPRFIKL